MVDDNTEPDETPAPPPTEPDAPRDAAMQAWIDRTTGRNPEPPPIEVTDEQAN